jgi:hypothetical protein
MQRLRHPQAGWGPRDVCVDGNATASASGVSGGIADGRRSPKSFRRPCNVVTRSFLKYRLLVCDGSVLFALGQV